MKYVERLLLNQTFVQTITEIEKLEEKREFCKHGWEHLLNVSRIAYIMNLEQGFGMDKELIYLCGLLHDIGRAREYATGQNHDEAGQTLAEQILEEIRCPKEYREEILHKVSQHRHAPMPEEGITKDNFFWFADKKARNCFSCTVREKCNWPEEKRTMKIEW